MSRVREGKEQDQLEHFKAKEVHLKREPGDWVCLEVTIEEDIPMTTRRANVKSK